MESSFGLVDLAVSPLDPNRLVVASSVGTLASSDRGQNWTISSYKAWRVAASGLSASRFFAISQGADKPIFKIYFLDDKLDRGDPYGRHGGDIEGVLKHLDYIAEMGFTQIWLNPILENAVSRASYHGYSTTDYYRVDPRFGSNESYREFVAAARDQGIGVIMDLIVNHAGNGHWWSNDLPTSDWYNLPNSKTITSHARTTNQDPYASTFDKSAHADGWFVETHPDPAASVSDSQSVWPLGELDALLERAIATWHASRDQRAALWSTR